MNGTDLEISFYNGIPLSPFFTTSDELGAGQLWNVDALNNFVPPSFMVTLSEHQSGQYGILLNGPLKLGATKIDNANGDPDAAAIASHNQAVAYITNNGQFNLTLGEMVSRSPLTNSETGQPLEFITKTGPGDDQNIGDETDENINGEAGDDIIDGREGDDEIEGGFGDDQISGGEGDDILSGGAGDDVIYGCAGSDQQKGGSGIDTISYASSGSGVSVDFSNNTVSGGDAEGDTIEGFEIAVGSAFDDSLTGGASADQFFGGNGNDVLFGNEGDDLLVGGNGADFIDGGAGLDTASYHNSAASIMVDLINQVASGGSAEGDMLSSIEGVIGGNFADTIIGNNLNNHLFGGAGDDVIFGGTGDDTIEGGQGADILDGGEGIDTLSFASATEAVSVSLNQAATLELSLFNLSLIETNLLEPDQFTGFENLNGSAFDDFLEGDAGDNVLWGGNGDDTFYATAGADVILGGAGSDTLDFIESFEAIELDLANRVYSGGYAEAIDIKSIENIYGTSFDDLIIGNAADNILNGSAGNDQLQGGAGDDQINGGAGTDDTAIFTGTLADYKITRAGGDSLRFEDLRTSQLSDGIDLVSEVENFQFSDGIAALLDLTIANAAPDLGDDLGLSANEDQIIIIDPLTLLANDAEYDGETLTITEVFNAKHGEVQLLGNGTIEFTPDQNYNGTASFEYRATDGVTMPASAKVSINYQPVTDAPVANFDGFLNIYAGQPTLISKEDLFFNDQEFDGQQLEITELVSVSGGTATLTTEGDVLFTPSVNSGEEITFEYKAGFVDENNNLVTSDFATVLATLQQPLSYTAEDDQFEGNENQPLVIQQADLFGNDINGGANSATILEVLSVSNGSVILDQQGNLIFTPETGFSGIAGFTYRAGNNQGGEDTASVNINIIADQQNAPPVAVDDNGLAALTTNEDTPLVIEAATLLQNDSDPDDDPLTIISVMDASNGTVVLGQGGNILFTPDENYNGTASFSYLLSDNNGNQDTATVTLDVVSVNDAPEELTLSNMNIDENSPEGTLIGELAATDPDLNETFTYAITGGDGAALFEILQNQLVLKSGVVLDFEQQSEYGLVIQATDSGNLSIENGFTISINDILESGAIIGTPFDDVLQGGAADDIISGLAGNDILFGGAGNDLLIGGTGADDIYGGEGIDTVDYSGSTSGINLTLTTLGITSYGIGIGGSASGDKLRDIENVIGSGHGDLIIGDQQENLIDGGAGRDYLAGGSGADQFIFKEDYGKDTILDFDTSGAIFDKIVIDFEGIDNFADLSSHIEGHGWFNLSTRITFNNNDQLTLLGVRANELNEDHFDFV